MKAFLKYFFEGIKGTLKMISDGISNPGALIVICTISVSVLLGFWYAVMFFVVEIFVFAICCAIASTLGSE